MENKEIYIDGVDVLNCGYFSQFEGKTQNACYIREKIFIGKEEIGKEYCSCETNPNCYYKQLKAKEQECEALNKVAKTHLAETFEMQKDINLLKIENEMLKEKLETVYDDCKGCSTCNEALYNANLYAKEYRKLKQALQEIKELAEYDRDCEYECSIKQILQKISEVE